MCTVDDREAKEFALQSLELLAIESPDTVCAQRELLTVLIELPLKTVELRLQTLTVKILLYFCESPEVCVITPNIYVFCRVSVFLASDYLKLPFMRIHLFLGFPSYNVKP